LFSLKLIRIYTIISEQQFENELDCSFQSKYDPYSKAALNMKFPKDSLLDYGSMKGAKSEDDDEDKENTDLFRLAAKD